MSVIKDVKIKTGAETYDTRDIGAEAQNIIISRNASGDIIEDITEPGIVVASTESLTHTLKGMQSELDFDTIPTSGSENPVTSGGIYNAIQADSALSPTSEKPVQNKVITAAITNKIDNTVISDDIETINQVAVGNYSVGDTFMADNGKYYKATDDIISNVDLILVGTNCQLTTVGSQMQTLETAISNTVLYFSGQACSALTGDFCTISNANITANHVVAEAVFANPSAITTDVTWTTASGSLKLNGTCSTATTVNIVLIKKNN